MQPPGRAKGSVAVHECALTPSGIAPGEEPAPHCPGATLQGRLCPKEFGAGRPLVPSTSPEIAVQHCFGIKRFYFAKEHQQQPSALLNASMRWQSVRLCPFSCEQAGLTLPSTRCTFASLRPLLSPSSLLLFSLPGSHLAAPSPQAQRGERGKDLL